MRIRELTTGALVVFIALTQMSAANLLAMESENESCPGAEEGRRRVPESKPVFLIPEPPALVKKDEVLATAYYDAMKILGANNRCSSFFGGSQASVGVFGSFVASIRKDYLPSSIGLKMSGDYTNVLNASTLVKYRLFDRASLNSGGPFYRQQTPLGGSLIAGVGSFRANSREARVLMLLHELGHLMKGADGKWLLPDDGKSMADSLKNTRTVESVCGDQIRALGKHDDGAYLAQKSNSERTVSPAAATSSH